MRRTCKNGVFFKYILSGCHNKGSRCSQWAHSSVLVSLAAEVNFPGRAPTTITTCVSTRMCKCKKLRKQCSNEYRCVFPVEGAIIWAVLWALLTRKLSVSIRLVLIFCVVLPQDLFLVDREQIWTLCLWFCEFWACSLSKHEWEKRMWGQAGCYTRACFSSRVYKKNDRVCNYDCAWRLHDRERSQ